ncbi:MAG: YggT family protein [Candidatus Obscuribacterales bacterium]|nr:YggT family protein [Candidatus Obscuribacterales bacterium]
MSIGVLIYGIIQAINMVVILWCLLSWFPNIKWYEQPFKTLDNIVQPIVTPFRRILPTMGGIDLSPMLTIFVLQFVGSLARNFLP